MDSTDTLTRGPLTLTMGSGACVLCSWSWSGSRVVTVLEPARAVGQTVSFFPCSGNIISSGPVQGPRQRTCFCPAQGLAINRRDCGHRAAACRTCHDVGVCPVPLTTPNACRQCRCPCTQSRSTSSTFMTTLGQRQKPTTSLTSAAALTYVLSLSMTGMTTSSSR